MVEFRPRMAARVAQLECVLECFRRECILGVTSVTKSVLHQNIKEVKGLAVTVYGPWRKVSLITSPHLAGKAEP
jgi:hypothetical protein